MARRKIRTGVRTSIRTIKTMAALFRKAANLLMTEAARLKNTDARIRRLRTEVKQKSVRKSRVTRGMKGGVSTADIAFQILSARKKPMDIQTLATRVIAKKKGKPGEHFTQNLAAAMMRDKRFKRMGRGVYGLSGSS